MNRHFRMARPLAALPACLLSATPLFAHEAWLLTPSEIAELSVAPVPALFTSHLWLGLSACLALALTWVALQAEPLLLRLEEKILPPVGAKLGGLIPLIPRVCMASMLLLAAFGGLPRHGTPIWTQPTFLVPDMQLGDALQPLVFAQFALGSLLLLGFFTRLCGAVLVVLSLLGLAMFGRPFFAYAPHFIAPGLILIACGGGRLSLDWLLKTDFGQAVAVRFRQGLWLGGLILIGAGFVYLGVVYKLLQPTLLIAILEHGEMPQFGLPMPVIALIMTGVEVICGILLMAGRLVRLVALAILGAITFLAIVLAETPLFHANLYGCLALVFLFGRGGPVAHTTRTPSCKEAH